MSVWKEAIAQLSDEARAQWNDNDTDDYKWSIQSCYNCRRWCKDVTLMGDYAWNRCRIEERNFWGALGTRFDCCCPDYIGYADVPNITWLEIWEKGLVDWMLAELDKRKKVKA